MRMGGGKWKHLGRTPVPMTPAQFGKLIADENRRVAFDAACILIAHGHGKPREHVMVEQQEIMAVQYRSVEEIEQSLMAKGIPIDRLNAPKLIEHGSSS
jgi:hypothetical protein